MTGHGFHSAAATAGRLALRPAILWFPALASLLIVLASAAQAQATPAQVEKLVQTIAGSGCLVTPENNADILKAAGLDSAAAEIVVSTILGLGQAEIEGGNLRLKTAGCE